ncbi:MAG TPA: glycine cleavage system aminomethyltransferase GcvT [Polyangia bacterium]
MKQTPLYGRHKALGAKVIDFGGWAMPVQYSGILDEHKTVREAAGIFDVSHMGEVIFRGPRAAEAVQRLVTNDVGKLADGKALYSCACRPSGGIVDDLIVYREGDEYLIVVNASNRDKDVAWFREQVGGVCDIEDASDRFALLAVQGPKAVALVQSLADAPVAQLPSFGLRKAELAGQLTRVARTGYTGEDGFEIFVAADGAGAVWDALLDAGAKVGLKPIGLGARDTLRLEARLSLYGNDIDEEHTPHEAGLSWVVKGKGFLGEEALARQKAAGVTRKLVGFVMKERGTARHGYAIVDGDGKPIGVVTSGSLGPTVGVNIGLGYVPTALAQAGARLQIDCRGKSAAAEVVNGPFYKRRS